MKLMRKLDYPQGVIRCFKNQVEHIKDLCYTFNTIIITAQSNTLINIELNKLENMGYPCSTPKSHSTDYSTISNNNTTYELVKKGQETSEQYTNTHPSHSNTHKY